ncbi:hypothetical protein Tco_1379626 [Tanacetum coccineum]
MSNLVIHDPVPIDDDVDIEGDEEEEEHPAPADSTPVALPVVDHAPSAEETGPFETNESATIPPPHPAYRVTARMSIRDETPISLPFREEVERLLALPSPPPSPLSPWSSPLPQIPSPSLPVSPPSPVSPPPLPASLTYPLGYRAAMIRLRVEAPSTSYPLPLPLPIVLPRTRASVAMMRAAAPSTYILAPRSEAPPSETPPLLPIPLPTLLPPLLLPSTNRRADVREACLSPRKRLCFAFGLRYEVGESSSAPTARPDGDFKRDYGFIATLDDEIMRDPERDAVAHRSEITELRAADRRRQTQLTEALKLMKTLQTQLTVLQSRHGPARGPTQPDAPEEAGSSS